MPAKILIVIPARYGSTRFPGKVLADLGGKPVIQHVYERAVRAWLAGQRVIVATDDERVRRVCERFGAPVEMTPRSCRSGTDRIARVAARYRDYPIVVNLQGDEPLLPPGNIRKAVRRLIQSGAPVATLAVPLAERERSDPNAVKVAISGGWALYFSRAAIPFDRDRNRGGLWRHIGIYVYRRDFLLRYARMKQTPLEKLEKLEQLRVLENGYAIAVAVTAQDSPGIDTPADLKRARARLRR